MATPDGRQADKLYCAKYLAQAIAQRRKELELDAATVAEQIGVSTSFYGRLERGQALPGVKTLALLGKALQISTDALLGLDISRRRPSSTTNKLTRAAEKLCFRMMELPPDVRDIAETLLTALNAYAKKKKRRKGT